MEHKTAISGLSLFSGAGGMNVGFIRAGVNGALAKGWEKVEK
jgi:site-specific DNA-cytosine methylase